MRTFLRVLAGLAPVLFFACVCGPQPRSATAAADAVIAYDPATRYQTIDGWEATAYSAQDNPAYAQLKDEIFRQAVEEVGINRIRLEVYSGSESDRDYYQDFKDGKITSAQWRAARYATVDDNGDPDVADSSGFHFTQLDEEVSERVLPLRSRLQARGEKLHVNLCYVAFTKQISNGLSYHHDDVKEYGEFVLTTFRHLKDTWNLVPDTFELILEPDNTTQWSGTRIGQALVETKRRLSAAGFTPGYVGPSTTDMARAGTYFDDLAKVPGAKEALTQLSYHRYSGVSLQALQGIANRAAANGLTTAHLEHIGATYDTLFEDLTVGQNSAWQQFTLASWTDDGSTYMWLDRSTTTPRVRLGTRTRYLRLFFLWARRGAVRVGATSDTPSTVDAVAFLNTDARPVVVVRAKAAANFTVTGLPAGTYGIRYATAATESADLADVELAPGAALSASIPAAGVVAVRAKVLASPPPPPPPPGGPKQVRAEDAPAWFDLPAQMSADAKRFLEFSTDATADAPLRLRVPKGKTRVAPPQRLWLKVLRLGLDGSTIRVRASDGTDVEDVEEVELTDPTPPAVLAPAADAALDRASPPTVTFHAGSSVRSAVEFASTATFDDVLAAVPLRRTSSKLRAKDWKRVVSALDGAGAGTGGYVRVAGSDVLGRATASAPRAFSLDAQQ